MLETKHPAASQLLAISPLKVARQDKLELSPGIDSWVHSTGYSIHVRQKKLERVSTEVAHHSCQEGGAHAVGAVDIGLGQN